MNWKKWLSYNPYKKLWSLVGGRPWTFIWRDIYHTAPIVVALVWFIIGVTIYQWKGWLGVGIFWPIYILGFIGGHFHWGKKYIPGQEGK